MSAESRHIDLLKIHPINGDQRFAFEELCCQLAADEPVTAGTLFYRKGSGADAGVECFTASPNGTETGWQAKFFQSFGVSQAGQLTKSIEQALDKHPRLTKYIVCLPLNLKDSRANKETTELERWSAWRLKQIAGAKKGGRALEIELWDARAIVSRLTSNDAKAAGRLAFFLGELHLTRDWFKARFRLTTASLQERYTPQFDVALPIRKAIWGLSRQSELREAQLAWLKRLRSSNEWLGQASEGIFPSQTHAEASQAWSDLQDALRVEVSPSLPHPAPTWKVLVDGLRSFVETGLNACRAAADGASKERLTVIYVRRQLLHDLDDLLRGMRAGLESELFRFVNDKAMLVYGAAGEGKSHLLADATDEALDGGRPAVMLLTSTFVASEPTSQVLANLDVRGHSFEVFLGAMNAAGQAAGVRALILIDALNERHGLELWRENLPQFVALLSQFPHVALCLSCRTTYLPAILPPGRPFSDALARIEHIGFSCLSGASRRLAVRPF